MKTPVKKTIKWLLALGGLSITRRGRSANRFALGYIPAKETVSAAKRIGLSVSDYVERLWGEEGVTQAVIASMTSCGALDAANPNVLEIGPGTGRYLERVLQKCNPARYEIYETSRGWTDWLKSNYPVIAQEADGVSLRQTPDGSVDLVQAHGVFVYLPFLVSYRYWMEIWRVTRRGGFVVFDIFSEESLTENTVSDWLRAGHVYPCFLSKAFVIDLFVRNGFSPLTTFCSRRGAGRSEYLVFSRNGPGVTDLTEGTAG